MSSKNQLIDPSLLEGLTDEQRREAIAAAEAARRAEERADQRALERALKRKEEERKREKLLMQQEQEAAAGAGAGGKRVGGGDGIASSSALSSSAGAGGGKLVFVSKRKRGTQEQKDNGNGHSAGAGGNGSLSSQAKEAPPAALTPRSVKTLESMIKNDSSARRRDEEQRRRQHEEAPKLSVGETMRIREAYLGKSAVETEDDVAQRRKKQRSQKKITFKFRWDNADDTFNDAADGSDPLYDNVAIAARLASSSARAAPGRHHHNHNNSQRNPRGEFGDRGNGGRRAGRGGRKRGRFDDDVATVDTVRTKPLAKMTPRDWRIFRENYEITVKGGKAPPPLRSFRESPHPDLPSLHPALLDALENAMRFKEPTPIQRQAITIGLQRRDLIGIAETGSGKTVAFGVPLCQYLLNLPSKALDSVASNGPLAIVMAPTRELALQIDVEMSKILSRQRQITTCAVVGGQPIQQQATVLRKGVHVVVGTPGRINDCIEMAYLVLNQCSYIVLDEADRMIDMGFAPQMETILDAMGGALKSENEEEAYEQEKEDLLNTGKAVAKHRLTAMFSATMPLEVEKMAKKYLRHPAVVSVGGQDTGGKNARITQKVVFLSSPAQKEKALADLLRNTRFAREKIIVFVNEKKHADGVGRMVERSGRECVVMHGGKSQEQREENLEKFRRGGVVMVATDVAGR